MPGIKHNICRSSTGENVRRGIKMLQLIKVNGIFFRTGKHSSSTWVSAWWIKKAKSFSFAIGTKVRLHLASVIFGFVPMSDQGICFLMNPSSDVIVLPSTQKEIICFVHLLLYIYLSACGFVGPLLQSRAFFPYSVGCCNWLCAAVDFLLISAKTIYCTYIC